MSMDLQLVEQVPPPHWDLSIEQFLATNPALLGDLRVRRTRARQAVNGRRQLARVIYPSSRRSTVRHIPAASLTYTTRRIGAVRKSSVKSPP